jgi:hypothetical protein
MAIEIAMTGLRSAADRVNSDRGKGLFPHQLFQALAESYFYLSHTAASFGKDAVIITEKQRESKSPGKTRPGLVYLLCTNQSLDLHQASQKCTTVFLKCTTKTKNAPHFNS